MPNWKSAIGGGLSGAASGAAAGTAIMPGWGTAIGGALGLVGGIIPGLGDSSGDDYAQMLKLYQDTLANYKGPESQPGYKEQMAGLADTATGKLTAQDQADLLSAYTQGTDAANGREGAIEQNVRSSGGGYATSGALAAAGARAGQGAIGAMKASETNAAGQASDRGVGARLAYLRQLTNNAASMNNYRLHAAQLLGGGYADHAAYEGANSQAQQDSWQGALDTGGRMLYSKYGKAPTNVPPLATGPAGNVGGDNYAAALPGRSAYPTAAAGDYVYPQQQRQPPGGPRQLYTGGEGAYG